MQKFNQIVCVDNTRLTQSTLEALSEYSYQTVKVFDDYPTDKGEIMGRIADADCLLVSWKTPIDQEIIEAATSLKYIGMCCSLIDKASANLDVNAAENKGIVVRGVKDYGDEGVVEFIMSQLISLSKGIDKHQWKPQQTELKNKTLGIIGFGTVGQMLAKVAVAFGMNVLYFSRTRKPSLEESRLRYATLRDVLTQSDAVSTHLPRKTKIFGKAEFDLLSPNTVFINTSVGPTFETEALFEWVNKHNNYAIFDHDGAFGLQNLELHPRIVYFPKTSGMTDAAFERLSEKVMENLRDFLQSV